MCSTGKIEHATRDAALDHLKTLVFQNHSRGASQKSRGLNAYPCDECNTWHVGHAPSGPRVYHYTVMSNLDAIMDSGVLRARHPRIVDRKKLRGLSMQQRRAVLAMEEPEPLLWFSRNAEWEYSVIKTLMSQGHKRIGGVFGTGDLTLTRRSDLEVNCGGLVRFVVPPWCAKLRWSDYLARNVTPTWLRDGMAKNGDPVDWLCTDEDVPLERVRDIQVYYNGAWTPVADVSDDAFDAYIKGRADAYDAAAESLKVKLEHVRAAGETQLLLSEAEDILYEDYCHTVETVNAK